MHLVLPSVSFLGDCSIVAEQWQTFNQSWIFGFHLEKIMKNVKKFGLQGHRQMMG